MAVWRKLTEHLLASDEATLTLSFKQIERLIQSPLPASAHAHAAFWANSEKNNYSRAWREAGYHVTRRGLAGDQIRFDRVHSRVSARPAVGPPAPAAFSNSSVNSLLVGCVGKKMARPAPAKDLYDSDLFRKRRRYAEAAGRPWMILSALHGLVAPEQVIAPYDVTLTSASVSERNRWGRQVVTQLQERLGPLQGQQFEIHAGDEYVRAIESLLVQAGASLMRPLQGLGIGEQLQWYLRNTPGVTARDDKHGPPSNDASTGLAREITEAFHNGALDLSERIGAPPPGWQSMPEVVVANHVRQAGAENHEFRMMSAFLAAMDRARDADRLWFAGRDLWDAEPWCFHPAEVVQRSFTELSDSLIQFRVSQRHLADAGAWLRIAETLVHRDFAPGVHDAVFVGVGNARHLLGELQKRTERGTARFPFLAGPKVGPMWIRMLAYPGGANIEEIEVVPVAVDVQIRKVSEYLGATDTHGQDLESVRATIQDSWHRDVKDHGAAGPDPLKGTDAALDPALWFYGKWGCTFCERAGNKKPISSLCGRCRFDELR